jgi:YD repeat-containing protein
MSNELTGECRYFLTYSGVKLPFNLLNPLEPEQIENRNTYFQGYFDEQNRLLGLQKMVYGEQEMEHRYTYHANGALQAAEIIDIDGEVTVLNFDESGQPLDS